MLRKAIGLAAALLAAGIISGCNQNQHKNAEQKPAQQELARGGHHGLRNACAEDIEKYCANEDRKKRCLRDNIDKLSEGCKAALAQHGGHKRGGRDNDNNDGDNN